MAERAWIDEQVQMLRHYGNKGLTCEIPADECLVMSEVMASAPAGGEVVVPSALVAWQVSNRTEEPLLVSAPHMSLDPITVPPACGMTMHDSEHWRPDPFVQAWAVEQAKQHGDGTGAERMTVREGPPVGYRDTAAGDLPQEDEPVLALVPNGNGEEQDWVLVYRTVDRHPGEREEESWVMATGYGEALDDAPRYWWPLPAQLPPGVSRPT